MLRLVYCCVLVMALMAPTVTAPVAQEANSDRTGKRSQKSVKKQRQRGDDERMKRPNTEDEFAARASAADAAGAYSSMSNWARAALGEKNYGH